MTSKCLKDGLFSAVVTAFIVLAVAMLQEDTGQRSVDLLSQITNQLGSLTFTPPYINSTTAAADTDPKSFRPTTAARWINILWFLSLTFSLTSAVLGILVKQWIREYLKWCSSTASARENVLVRQIRDEAWDEWHTTTIIASIPALLELAVILFICGMTVFLGTLDLVVAIVVSIFAGIFLLLIAAFTLLPTIYKRCPYKSPTAWAVVRVWGLLAKAWTHVSKSFFRRLHPTTAPGSSSSTFDDHFEIIHSTSYSDTEPTWRLRDLLGARLSRLREPRNGSISNAQSVLLEELEIEIADTVPLHGSVTQTAPGDSSGVSLAPVVTRTYSTALGESDSLFRALVWLFAEIPDSDALRHLSQCVQTILPSLSCAEYFSALPSEVRLTEMAVDGGFRCLSIWYMLSRVNRRGSGYMGSFLHHPCIRSKPTDDEASIAAHTLAVIRNRILELDSDDPPDSPYTFLPPVQVDSDKAIEYAGTPLSNSQYIVMSYVLAHSFKSRVVEMLHPSTTCLTAGPGVPVSQLLLRRLEEMLFALRYVALYWDSALPLLRSCQRESAQILADTFNIVAEHSRKQDFDLLFPALRYQMFWVLSTNQYSVRFRSNNTLVLESQSSGAPLPVLIVQKMSLSLGLPLSGPAEASQSDRWLSLATDFSLNSPHLTHEDFTIFAQVVSYALASITRLSESQIDRLSGKAATALQRAASSGSAETAGFLHDAWTHQLVQITELGSEEHPICSVMLQRSPNSLLRLLRALQANEKWLDQAASSTLLDVLAAIHSDSKMPTTNPAISTLPDALFRSTTMMLRYPLGLPTHTQPWHHLFVWAGSNWITDAACGFGHPSAKTDDSVRVVEDVLAQMVAGLIFAIRKSWENCGYDDAAFPWPQSLLTLPVGLADIDQIEEGSVPLAVLHDHAPKSVELLMRSLQRAVDARLFCSRLTDYDTQLAAAFIVAPSLERKRILSWRARLAQGSVMASKCYRCSYHLP